MGRVSGGRPRPSTLNRGSRAARRVSPWRRSSRSARWSRSPAYAGGRRPRRCRRTRRTCPRQSSPITSTSAAYCSMYSRLSSRLSSTNTSSTIRRAATISSRSDSAEDRLAALLAQVEGVRGHADHEAVAERGGALDHAQVPDVEDVERAEGDHGARHGALAAIRGSRPRRAGRESTAMTTTMTPAGPIAMITPDPAADARRRRGLRQMRTLAVCLLLLAAVVYLVTLGEDGVLGFVNAGAEASMVGAIADWFAVTALFKHPLGLPIPHTALIPKRKDDLGRSLEEFVGENFLQEGDHPRTRRVGGDLGAGRRLAGRPRARTPRGRRGLGGRLDRAGQGARRARLRPGHRGAGPAVPRGAARTPGRRAAGRGGARRCAPGRGRPGPRRAARVAARAPGHRRRGAGAAGAVVGAAPAQRRGDPPGHRRAGRPGSPRSAPIRPIVRGSAFDSMLDAARRRPAARPRDPRAHRASQGAGARPSSGGASPASRCGTRSGAPCRRRCSTRTARCGIGWRAS